jgi:hypothetical protein
MTKTAKPLSERRIKVWPHPGEEHHKLYNEVMRLTGETVAEWAAIEEHLARLLARAAGCPIGSATVIFYSLNSFSARLSMVKAAVQHCMKDSPDQQLILDALAKLRSLNKSRNDLIHASYTFIYGVGEKPVMARKLVRSERVEPIRFIKSQTGEIQTHLKKLYQAGQFFGLLLVGEAASDAAARRWAAIFLNTDSAISE